MRIRVATANIKGFGPMLQRKVRDDLIKMQKNAKPTLLATQEMWLPRYKRALRRVFNTWRHVAPLYRSACASYDANIFKETHREVLVLHRAIPGVCDKRVASIVELVHKATGRRFAFISIHPAPPATRKSAAQERAAAAARQQAWRVLKGYVSTKAMAVIIAGDFNEWGEPLGDTLAGKTVRYVSHGIDHIVFIDGKNYHWTIDRGTRQVLELHSDHDGLAVTAELR